jgi:hypothetical protein
MTSAVTAAPEPLPAVPRAPAPWALRGHAWIVLVHLPPTSAARTAFVPDALRGSLRAPVSALMCVEYTTAPCGPYCEVLFVPGAMRFPDGRWHVSISRILVSTWDSVVNGRANWGIPKERADILIERDAERDGVRVLDAERERCRIEFGPPRGPRLPLRTTWLPVRWSTLAQWHEGQVFYYRPQARGSLRPARLLRWTFDAEWFPDLAEATVLASMRVEDFTMEFPVAQVVATEADVASSADTPPAK